MPRAASRRADCLDCYLPGLDRGFNVDAPAKQGTRVASSSMTLMGEGLKTSVWACTPGQQLGKGAKEAQFENGSVAARRPALLAADAVRDPLTDRGGGTQVIGRRNASTIASARWYAGRAPARPRGPLLERRRRRGGRADPVRLVVEL